MTLDFSRCRDVWVPDDSEAGGFWSPPFPHVKEAVKEIVEHPYFLLATDMGGAKTASAIIAAHFLFHAGTIDRVIVLAPASVRPKVWYDEDLGQLREQVWEDTRNMVSEYHQRIRSWTHGPEGQPELRWICTNYEYIRSEENLAVLLPYCGPKTLLVLDEAHAVKGYDSKQTDACMRLRWLTNKNKRPVLGAARCGRVLLMTGTPIADSPMDAFSLGNLLHPSVLECRYVTHYKARYAIQVPVRGPGGKPLVKYGQAVQQVQGWTNLEDLTSRFAPYVLRREAEELGINFALPPVALEVRLTEKTWKAYRKMRDEMVVWLESGRVATSATAAVKALRLAQITSGFLGGIEDSGVEGAWLGEGQGESIREDVLALIGAVQMDQRHPYDFADIQAAKQTAVPGAKASDVLRGVVQEIGREKLDFALAWHAGLLEHHPDLKLVTWCRFVPELRRYLAEVKKLGHPVGAACGEVVLGGRNVTEEREVALRLLNPKTAPAGPATVGATQGTGAVGLNFTACRTVLDMSYDFSPWKKRQGDSRFNRPGQTGPVSFFYLIAVGPQGQKTVDHHIMLTRLGKMDVNDLTMKGWVKMLREE